MVTYLAALRFAPNVEHLLQVLQNALFSKRGFVSALALPPLIPLAWMADRPTDHVLDRIRKTHRVQLLPQEGSAGAQTPCAIRIGERASIDSLATSLSHVDVSAVAERASIRLAWECEEEDASPVPLPGTSALWLSIVRVHSVGAHDAQRPTGRWWDGLRWTEEYRRRLTVRERRS